MIKISNPITWEELTIEGVKYRLGVHDTPELASIAYKTYEKEHAYAGTSIG